MDWEVTTSPSGNRVAKLYSGDRCLKTIKGRQRWWLYLRMWWAQTREFM